MLDWMMEGWHFGERKSKSSALGYVPSLKGDGFIKLHEAKKVDEMKKKRDEDEQAKDSNTPLARQLRQARGTLSDRWGPIHSIAGDRVEKEKHCARAQKPSMLCLRQKRRWFWSACFFIMCLEHR